MRERGQVIVLFSAVVVVVLAIGSLVLDGGRFLWRWQALQIDLDAACLAQAGGRSFADSLERNGVDEYFYHPYAEGTKGIQYYGDGFRAWLSGPLDTYLTQFLGLDGITVHVQTRCNSARAPVLPIAVKEQWASDIGGEYPILGDGAECEICQGSDFRGAVIPQVWCENENCEPKTFFDPAEEKNSPNVFKSLWEDTIQGNAGSPLVDIGTRAPQLAGVSNNFLVKGVQEAGFEVGDEIIVMVYNGTIAVPEPGNAMFENIEVIYYMIAEITEFDNNTMFVSMVERLDTLDDVRRESLNRTIPYDWGE